VAAVAAVAARRVAAAAVVVAAARCQAESVRVAPGSERLPAPVPVPDQASELLSAQWLPRPSRRKRSTPPHS